MVVGFTTTCVIRACHHYCCEFEPRSWRRGVFDTTLCDKICQWLATVRWFSPGTPVSSTNKIGLHHITEVLLKVTLNTINHKPKHPFGKQNICLYSHILSVWFIVRIRALVIWNTSHLTSSNTRSYKNPIKLGRESSHCGDVSLSASMHATDLSKKGNSNNDLKIHDEKHFKRWLIWVMEIPEHTVWQMNWNALIIRMC